MTEGEHQVGSSANTYAIIAKLATGGMAELFLARAVLRSRSGAVELGEDAKVVLLSHSTAENLCRDWVNTHALASADTRCPGRGENEAPACHQMHYNWDGCKQAGYPKGHPEEGQPMGVAQCQVDLDFESVYKAVWHAVTWELERKAAARPHLKVVGGT